ncbi:MAG: LamG-like jellyroll fold domain-containing protein [Phycisphaerales bacterium]
MRQQHSRSLISADRVRPALVASLAGALAAAAAVASPPPGILAHWTFDQVGSATAVDGVGGANGTLVGGAAMVAGGVSGGALQLSSATGSLVDMGNVFPLLGATPCTVACWVKCPQGSSGPFIPVSRHAAGTLNGWFVGLGSGSACYGAPGSAWGYRSNVCGGESIGTTAVLDGQWHFIAITAHPNTGSRIYVDGGPPEDVKPLTNVQPNGVSLLVGGYTNGGVPTNAFDGLIDDLQIYGRALTCWEVNLLFSTPAAESQFEVDLNGDGIVDGADLGLLLANWGTPACDLNGDGIVDGGDLGVMLGNWGSC